MSRKKLPNKPSALIELALADLASAKRSGYAINMSVWHAPDHMVPGKKHCEVCFAGSVMACTLDIPHGNYVTDPAFEFDADTAAKLTALDSFRGGDVRAGINLMPGLDYEVLSSKGAIFPSDFDAASYEAEPRVFVKEMQRLAAHLKIEGL